MTWPQKLANWPCVDCNQYSSSIIAKSRLCGPRSRDLLWTNTKSAQPYDKIQEINKRLGDFYAKVGKWQVEDVVRDYEVGLSHDRTSYFRLPPRSLYTWISPADNTEKIPRNQIDYVIINKTFRNTVKSVKAYPGTDVYSNHNLLLDNIKTRLKTILNRGARKLTDIYQLKKSPHLNRD